MDYKKYTSLPQIQNHQTFSVGARAWQNSFHWRHYLAAQIHMLPDENVLELAEYDRDGLINRFFIFADNSWFCFNVRNRRCYREKKIHYGWDSDLAINEGLLSPIIAEFFFPKNMDIHDIFSHQQDVLYEMRKERLEKREEQNRSKLWLFNDDVPEWVVDEAKRLVGEAFIFFRYEKNLEIDGIEARRGAYIGCCTNCNEEFELDYPFKHNERIYCPECGVDAVYKSKAFSYSKLVHSSNIGFIERLGEDKVGLRLFHFRRNYNSGRAIYDFDEYARYYFAPGEAKMFCNEYKTGSFWGSGKIQKLSCFELKGKVTTFDGNFKLLGSIEEALQDTFLENQSSAVEGIFDLLNPDDKKDYLIIDVLKKISLYPALEYIYKLGFHELTEELICYSLPKGNTINLRGKNATEALGFPLGFLRQFDVTNLTVRKLMLLKLLGGKTNDLVKEIINSKGGTFLWRFGLDKFKIIKNPLKALNYIKKQSTPQRDFHTTLNDYYDYLQECEQLNYDLNDKAILYPRSLAEAHQRTMIQIEYARNKDKEEAYAKAIKKWLNKSYSNGEFNISVVSSVYGLIAYARQLHNCAGGYVDRITRGLSVIFIIMQTSAPEEPYNMLELNPKTLTVVQCRGYKNASAPPMVEEFVQEWLEEKILKKEKPAQRVAVAV